MLHAGVPAPKVELPNKKRGKVKQEPEEQAQSAEEEEAEEDVADAPGSDEVSDDEQQQVEGDVKPPEEGAEPAEPPGAGATEPDCQHYLSWVTPSACECCAAGLRGILLKQWRLRSACDGIRCICCWACSHIPPFRSCQVVLCVSEVVSSWKRP